MKKIFSKVFFCFIIIVLSSSFLMSCGKDASSPGRIADNNISENTGNIEKNDSTAHDEVNTALKNGVVALVNGEELKAEDFGYYIYNNAVIQMYKEDSNTTEDVTTFDWSKTNSDGKTLSDVVVENAIDDAINDVVFKQSAENSGFLISGAEKEADELVNGSIERQGEEKFKISANLVGVPDAETYKKIYTNISVFEGVAEDFQNNPEKYVVDISVLSDYIGDKGASVQHVLILNDTDDASQVAEEVLQKAKNGEDFLELMKQYNDDTSEKESGYTFPEGEMVPTFETAAFSLKIGEISDIVESDYGFHIIKRIVGAYELQNFWRSEADVKILPNSLQMVNFYDVMNMIKEAKSKNVG